jgi:GNAT superfamily N-acetyltransferase
VDYIRHIPVCVTLKLSCLRWLRNGYGSVFMSELPEEMEYDAPRLEPAVLEDLPRLVELLTALFEEEEDFVPDPQKQEHGLRLILEQPNRGRIFVLRTDHLVIGMANLLFTISTAEGGLVVLLEDVVVHPQHRGQGYGSKLLRYAIDFARDRGFKRITLLTDRISAESQTFFQAHGFKFSSMIPMRMVFNENR